jgi:capsular exopolysaccharide synthesis family protein
MAPAAEHPTDLREYVRVLRVRKFEVGIVALAALGAALFFSFRATPIYEGRAKVLVRPIQNVTSSSVSLPQAPNLDTERELAISQTVAQKARSDLGLALSVDDLLARVKVSVVADTEVLLVAYDDPDPVTAAKVANGFADAYVDFRTSQALDQFQAAAGAVQERINELQGEVSDMNRKIDGEDDPVLQASLQSQRDTLVAQLGVLQQRLVDLQAAGTALSGAAEVVQNAEPLRDPVSPQKARDGVLGLLAGLVLGVGFAFLRERMDDRIKSRVELERRMGAPVVAAVPRVPGWRRSEDAQLIMRRDPKNPVSEAYRTLGTNIQYMASQQQLRVIMLTSSMGGEGKSTTTSNLAVVLAQAGKRVILISADLRRPRIHNFFGLRNELGLSNVLSEGATLAQVARDPGVTNLRIVTGGFVPHDPAALLGGQRAARFIESLREVADFVLIDTPPVLAVADASILAPLVDGTVFVLDANHSSRSAMVQSRDQLDNAGANIIGIVYNNFDPGQTSAYPYYSSYYYQYYGTQEGRDDGGKRWRKRRIPSPPGGAAPGSAQDPSARRPAGTSAHH